MPYRLRQRQRRRSALRQRQQRRAVRNSRLRHFGRLNRAFGAPRRSTFLQRGLPLYPLIEHLAPPIPPTITQREFDTAIGHDVERGSAAYYEFWLGTREVVGDIMEYEFRRRFGIPVHIPRSAMKLILLFVSEGEETFGAEGLWDSPIEVLTFQWPRPFRWPLR